jgi:hypothetical protein
MSPDVFVERLCKMMGDSGHFYGIEWSQDYDHCFRALAHGVGLYFVLDILGFNNGVAHLYLFKDKEQVFLREPDMHFSQAPGGKFLRLVTTLIGNKEPWPRLPTTPEELANERLRLGLKDLCERAQKQCVLRAKEGRPLNQELAQAIKRGLFRRDFSTEVDAEVGIEGDEETKQRLFREVLGEKAA